MIKNERYFTTYHTGGAPNGIAILRTDGSLLVQPDRGAHLVIEGVAEAVLEENKKYLEWREEQGGTPGALHVPVDCRQCKYYRVASSCEWCEYPSKPALWAHGGAPPPDDCPLRVKGSS